MREIRMKIMFLIFFFFKYYLPLKYKYDENSFTILLYGNVVVGRYQLCTTINMKKIKQKCIFAIYYLTFRFILTYD